MPIFIIFSHKARQSHKALHLGRSSSGTMSTWRNADLRITTGAELAGLTKMKDTNINISGEQMNQFIENKKLKFIAFASAVTGC